MQRAPVLLIGRVRVGAAREQSPASTSRSARVSARVPRRANRCSAVEGRLDHVQDCATQARARPAYRRPRAHRASSTSSFAAALSSGFKETTRRTFKADAAAEPGSASSAAITALISKPGGSDPALPELRLAMDEWRRRQGDVEEYGSACTVDRHVTKRKASRHWHQQHRQTASWLSEFACAGSAPLQAVRARACLLFGDSAESGVLQALLRAALQAALCAGQCLR